MIIDTHVHIGGEAVGFTMNEDMVIEAMNKHGIDFAIVSNGDAGEVDHQQKLLPEHLQVSQEEALLRTINFAHKYPNKIGVAPWIKPLTEGFTKEFEKMVYDNKDIIYAIKLHPFHSKVSPIDDGVDTYLHNPKGERSLYQDYFCELPKLISKEEYEDVMYKNAMRVFNIGEF